MLRVTGAEVRFDGTAALAGADLEVADGDVVALLGPSGSGKTTLLRLVAGLESADAGRVEWEGADLAAVPAHRRDFGLMFQDFALFPHLDVGGNVAFGPRMHGVDAETISARVAEVLELVGLPGFADRTVGTLSGGEAQRVALARALAPGPRMLMLDEPLGSLDRALRERLMVELRELFTRLHLTVLYVTHDQEEAFAVADRVAVMRDGRIEREGAPVELWREPGTEFVARFLGFTNIVDAAIAGGVAVTPWGRIPVELPDGDHRIVVRPDGFRLDPEGPIAATVTSVTFRGDRFTVEFDPDAGPTITAALSERVSVGEHHRINADAGAISAVA